MSALYDFETPHLVLDHLGRVWLLWNYGADDEPEADNLDPVRLGAIDDDPEWPLRLGPKPAWFAKELAELVDQRLDAGRFAEGCHTAAEHAYLFAKGTI